jgi:hypothetical protein
MIITEKKLRKIISKIMSEDLYQEGFDDRLRKFLRGSSTSKIGRMLRGDSEDSSGGGGGGGIAPYKGGSPSSWTVEGSHAARAVELSKATGLDPAFVYAVERKESAHKPLAMAWNVHIMRNPKYAASAGVPGKALSADQSKELTDLGFPKKESYYEAEAQGMFAKAYEVNPWAAISAGAWGLYQVLGAFTLPDYGNDPVKWKAAFDADPVDFSKKSFIKWVKNEGSEFIAQANAGNYAYTTKKYFGATNTLYAKEIGQHAATYRQGIKAEDREKSYEGGGGGKAPRDVKGALTSWIGRLGKKRKGGENFHALKDGLNNYRGGIKPKHTTPSKEFFEELQSEYGIERIITLNGSAKWVGPLVKSAGLEWIYEPLSDSRGTLNLGSSGWSKIKNGLKKGNALIHCTHGADRTGATVGRWYVEKDIMSVSKAKDDAFAYNGKTKNLDSVDKFIEQGPA